MSEAADDLDRLVTSEGWRLFTAYVEREWGVSGVRFQQELTKALDQGDNNAAASQARQIVSAQKVIASLLRWPGEEVVRLKKQQPIPDVAVMSRRGGL